MLMGVSHGNCGMEEGTVDTDVGGGAMRLREATCA